MWLVESARLYWPLIQSGWLYYRRLPREHNCVTRVMYQSINNNGAVPPVNTSCTGDYVATTTTVYSTVFRWKVLWFLPSANEVWGKVMFLYAYVILFISQMKYEGNKIMEKRPGWPPESRQVSHSEVNLMNPWYTGDEAHEGQGNHAGFKNQNMSHKLEPV